MFLIAAFTFFVVIAVIMIVWWAFSPQAVDIERRLSATLKPRVSVARKMRRLRPPRCSRTACSSTSGKRFPLPTQRQPVATGQC